MEETVNTTENSSWIKKYAPYIISGAALLIAYKAGFNSGYKSAYVETCNNLVRIRMSSRQS